MFIGVVRLGTYTTHFQDVPLARERDRSRTLTGDASGLFLWALGRSDPLYGVSHMARVARDMLVLENVLEIDWDATYDVVPVLATGRYLYYDYIPGRFDELSETDTLPAVTP